MVTHDRVKAWIVEVLQANPGPVAVALRQRAKFEGWLKFELAAHMELSGAKNVAVETSTSVQESNRTRCDLSFEWDGARFDLELKTPNTNWRMPGVLTSTRPITRNILSIIDDARKATSAVRKPLVAFVLFPIPCGDLRWQQYLERISRELRLALTADAHATQVSLPLSKHDLADVVVCCFPASPNLGERLAKVIEDHP